MIFTVFVISVIMAAQFNPALAEGVFDNVTVTPSGRFELNTGSGGQSSPSETAIRKAHPYRVVLGWDAMSRPSSAIESQVLSRLAAAMSSSGRYLVQGVNLPRGVMADYRVAVWIKDLDLDGTHYFDTVKSDDGKRYYRRYSHTSVNGRLTAEIRILRLSDGRPVGSFDCFSSASDTMHMSPWSMGGSHEYWGDNYNDGWDPGYNVGGLNSYRFNMSFSTGFNSYGFNSAPPRMVNEMVEDLVRSRKGSIIQKLNDILPLRGRILGKSRSIIDNWYADLGHRDGVRNDERFLVIRNDRPIAIFRVNQVDSANCRGKVFLDGVETPLQPQIGDMIISRGW
jgi:hypothetical protein